MDNVFVIGLCFGREHLSGMLAVATNFCMQNLPHHNVHNIIVDNKTTENAEEASNQIILAGDNSCYEFSGWQKGIDYISRNLSPSDSDIILLINDTIHQRNYSEGGSDFYKKYKIPDPKTMPETWAAGYIDDFPKATQIGGLPLKQWIRSNFILLSYSCISKISPLPFPYPNTLLFNPPGSRTFWGENAPLSDNWKAYISSWLFGEENPLYPEYRLKWIKHGQLNKENWDHFATKARCIMSEHFLSAKLQSAGIPILDFNKDPKSIDRHLKPYYN